MPERRARLDVRCTFTASEMERLREGLVPEEMEDKWFVVWQDDALLFYRSWTGYLIHRVRFAPAPWGERIAEVEVNRDSDQYRQTDDRHDGLLLLFLMNDLLGRHAVFPHGAGAELRIVAEQGDITAAQEDAIVNAANEGLLGGGGVDGAIHRAAGRELLAACRSLPEIAPGVRCPTGEARITPAFGRLGARWVIHAVGPVYRGRAEDARLLASAVRASLSLAEEHGARSVAVPAISCGVYGYPLNEGARVAVGVARERTWDLDLVRFVLFSPDVLAAWQRALAGPG
jgi:O-acetyl-ADP-ribose deacetylase (regulator of RNase III)